MLYKKLFLFSLLFLSLRGFSQADTKDSKFQLGLIFSPNMCGISTNVPNNNLVPKFGYSGGINICYTINSVFGFEFGLQYANKGYRIKEEDIPAPFFGGNTQDVVKVRAADNYNYLDIPLKLNIMAGKNRLRFIGSVGVITGIFLLASQERKTTYSDGSVKSTRIVSSNYLSYNPIGLSPTVSAGIDYKISAALHLRIEPAFRYGLIKPESTNYRANLWSAGINIGAYFTL